MEGPGVFVAGQLVQGGGHCPKRVFFARAFFFLQKHSTSVGSATSLPGSVSKMEDTCTIMRSSAASLLALQPSANSVDLQVDDETCMLVWKVRQEVVGAVQGGWAVGLGWDSGCEQDGR